MIREGSVYSMHPGFARMNCLDSPEALAYDPDALVEAMFSGPKVTLKPLYERLLHFGLSLGEDVKACPGKTIVPFYRHHVFAQLKPSTNRRLDLGLALGDRPCTGRLLDTGGFAKRDRITHRIPLMSLDDFDREAEEWFRLAYTGNP